MSTAVDTPAGHPGMLCRGRCLNECRQANGSRQAPSVHPHSQLQTQRDRQAAAPWSSRADCLHGEGANSHGSHGHAHVHQVFDCYPLSYWGMRRRTVVATSAPAATALWLTLYMQSLRQWQMVNTCSPQGSPHYVELADSRVLRLPLAVPVRDRRTLWSCCTCAATRPTHSSLLAPVDLPSQPLP